jgi:hypothetical protein
VSLGATGTRSPRRLWLWLALSATAVVIAGVLVWFQPHKLFIDDKVNEAIPTATAGTTDGSRGAAAPEEAQGGGEPTEVVRGDFVSLDHGTSGVARVLELGDGSRIVRLEALDTDNGPDLFVYLSTNPVEGEEGLFDDDFVNLGRLKGNKGDQNYDLPSDVDLSRFSSVVIWCDRFDAAFGAAPLQAA